MKYVASLKAIYDCCSDESHSGIVLDDWVEAIKNSPMDFGARIPLTHQQMDPYHR
jgi:hypothetical protein